MMATTATARRLIAARPSSGRLLDAAIAGLAFAGSWALFRHGGIGALRTGVGGDASSLSTQELHLVGTVLLAGSTVPLIAWRRSPLGVFLVTAASGVLLAGLGYPVDLLLGPAVALYLLAGSREPRAPWTGRITAIVVGLFVTYLGAAALAQRAFPGYELLHTGLAWAAAWFAGERTRLRREQVASLKQRVRRAKVEADRERRLAAAEERARIARDLHDSAGHAISVIAVLAGAARLRHRQDPDRSLQAFQEIEDLARQTIEEIDQIVGTLRDSGRANDEIEAPLGLASLDTLIAHHTTAGLAVTLDTVGVPRPLGAAVDQAAYRILQEALTNAGRHGAGSAKIKLAFDDVAVELTVTNPVRAGAAPRSGGGHGLIGMRERATLLGGNLLAERANGAFRVHAWLPYGGHRT